MTCFQSSFRYWILLYPDSHEPIGGVKQAHRIAECIESLGRSVTIVQDDPGFHPGWFDSRVKTISRADWEKLAKSRSLNPSFDIVVLPELFLREMSDQESNGLSVVILCQNVSYSFGLDKKRVYKPSHVLGLYRRHNVCQVLCVSHYDYSILTSLFRLDQSKVSLIVNGLEAVECSPGLKKKRQAVCLVRKNPLDLSAVTGLLLDQPWFHDWNLVVLKRTNHADVLNVLRESCIYLSFGHPEGFGLPVAEAMASCCLVVGYSGLGGRELFDIGASFNTSVEVPVGDWKAYLDAIQRYCFELDASPHALFSNALSVSKLVRSRYSIGRMRESVLQALTRIEFQVSS